jgi:beta-glucosidase 2, glycosyl-hydrolase family 116 N-term
VHCSTFPESVKVASAVCLRKTIKGKARSEVGGKNKAEKNNKKTFSFSLSWDNPIVRFGEGAREADRSNTTGSEAASASIGFEAPRYYTRFFGDSGNSSSAIAVYGLVHSREWERRIVKWQEKVLLVSDAAMTSRDSTSDLTDRESSSNSSSGKTDSVAAAYSSDADADLEAQAENRYRPVSDKEKEKQKQTASESYRHQLFNELYFLVDGGTVWTDTQDGVSNLYAPYSVQDNAADRRGGLGGTAATDGCGNGGNRVSQLDAITGSEASKEGEMQRRSGMFCDILSSKLSVPIRDLSIESFLKSKHGFSKLSRKMTPESMDRCYAPETVEKNGSKMKAKNSGLPLESLREPLLHRLTGMLSWSRPGRAEMSESEESGVAGVGVGSIAAERGASRGGDGGCGEADARVAEHRRKSRKIMKAISVLHQQMHDHDKKVANSKIAGDQVLTLTLFHPAQLRY